MSRTIFNSWLNRKPSKTNLRANRIQAEIMQIYSDSHNNYGAPKITQILKRQGEVIAERTVGKYMTQMGIQAQCYGFILKENNWLDSFKRYEC